MILEIRFSVSVFQFQLKSNMEILAEDVKCFTTCLQDIDVDGKITKSALDCLKQERTKCVLDDMSSY